MSIFDNASSITIGGKEVKSIEINGGVIYEKNGTLPPNTLKVTLHKNGEVPPSASSYILELNTSNTGGAGSRTMRFTNDGEGSLSDLTYTEYRLELYDWDGNEISTTTLLFENSQHITLDM